MEETKLKPITPAGIVAIPGLIILFLIVTITVCFVCRQALLDSDVEYLVSYLNDNEKCGFINQNGTIILNANYDYCTELSDRYGLVNNTSGTTYTFSVINPYGTVDKSVKYHEDGFFVYNEDFSEFNIYIDHNLYDTHLNKLNDSDVTIISCNNNYCAYSTDDNKEYGIMDYNLKVLFKNTLESPFNSIGFDMLYDSDYFEDKYFVFDIDDKSQVVNTNTGNIVLEGNELRNYEGSDEVFNVAIDNGTDSHSPDYAYYYYYFYGDNYTVYESKISSLTFKLDRNKGYYSLVNEHNNIMMCYINLFTGEISDHELNVEIPHEYAITNIDEDQVARYGYQLSYENDKVGLMKDEETILDADYIGIYSFGVNYNENLKKDNLNYLYGITKEKDIYTFHLIDLNSKEDVNTYTSESANYVYTENYPYVVVGDYNLYALFNLQTGDYIETNGIHNIRNNSIEVLTYDSNFSSLEKAKYYTRDLKEITSYVY